MKADYYTDDVRGIIVDSAGTLYKFFTRHPLGFDDYLDAGVFLSDAEAEAWVAEHFPAAYARGIEMRVYGE